MLIVGGMVNNGRSARSLATLTLEVGNLSSMWVRAQGGGSVWRDDRTTIGFVNYWMFGLELILGSGSGFAFV